MVLNCKCLLIMMAIADHTCNLELVEFGEVLSHIQMGKQDILLFSSLIFLLTIEWTGSVDCLVTCTELFTRVSIGLSKVSKSCIFILPFFTAQRHCTHKRINK